MEGETVKSNGSCRQIENENDRGYGSGNEIKPGKLRVNYILKCTQLTHCCILNSILSLLVCVFHSFRFVWCKKAAAAANKIRGKVHMKIPKNQLLVSNISTKYLYSYRSSSSNNKLSIDIVGCCCCCCCWWFIWMFVLVCFIDQNTMLVLDFKWCDVKWAYALALIWLAIIQLTFSIFVWGLCFFTPLCSNLICYIDVLQRR